MADPDDSKDPTEERFVSIMDLLRSDGHGTLPCAKRAKLGSSGRPFRPRPMPKPHPLNSDDQE